MSDACCGPQEPRPAGAEEEHEPERIWEVTELRFAAGSGLRARMVEPDSARVSLK